MSENKFFYANSVEIAVSQYDVNLKFMRTGTPKPSLQPGGTQQVIPELLNKIIIGMSPQHTKALLSALTEALKQYEKTFSQTDIKK